MINLKKIHISIFITCISFTLFVFLMGKIITSDTWREITKVEIAFYELFNDFLVYLLMDIIGVLIAIYLLFSFVNKVRNSNHGDVILKDRIEKFKKEIVICTLIVVCSLIIGAFIEYVYYFNMLFVPIAIIFILTALVFVVIVDKYALKR